jgi:hypothetical protein
MVISEDNKPNIQNIQAFRRYQTEYTRHPNFEKILNLISKMSGTLGYTKTDIKSIWNSRRY